MEIQSAEEIRSQIAEKAANDEEFRSRLLSDPKGALEGAFDFKVPEGMDVQVHEESESVAHLVLPPSAKLSETQLAGVSGGRSTLYLWCI